ncbi:MAG: MarR family transcriptional regulator [Roseibium sp.]|uniref:MarR family winged helix-turn-helix transcriptional regulator n=1 Tax=Roseibium sp. TaxID=1936156 RepID=UPI0026224745|nr:MarR family transcriptional regulator [Roseibium sp.]MCV0427363.1 MarR family transcriptional regulator [Roseibium sp.]
MEFDRNSSAGYLIHHVARLFFEGLRKRIEPLGIVPGQFPALLALWQKDGQTQKELVEKLDIEQATMANTLNRMERDGLILRKDHPTDGRAKIIWLTPKAVSIRDEAYNAASTVNDMALADLSPEEREQFIGTMQRIIRTFRED